MAVQFGLADSYYVNAVEEPVEPQQEETTTTTPQEQEEVPTTEEETPQQQPAVEEEQPAPETKSVELSYVAEDGTVLHETASRDFNVDYSLKTDSSVMLNFDGYTLKDVIINNSQTVPADQANLSVTSDLVSVKFVYVSVNTKEDKQTSENNEQTKTEEANEDDAEADPETQEELPEYPAFDQSETAGNVVVHATAAEGVLPRDSKLVVKRITRKAILNAVEDTVSEKNKEMDSAVALDITIQNKDGVEIQPNGSVNISFENAAVSGDEINVYHVTDDASAVTEVATNTQSFDANHFSIYVITGEKEKPLTTFNFVANGNIVSKQIVKTGDELITPTAPDVAGKAFVGWYEGETKFEDFNTALTITETKTREITAKYEDALYVYFYNPKGTQIMRTEKIGDHEAHDFTTVSYEVDSTHKLVGWAAEKNGTENIADKIKVPADQTSVNVYAIIKEGYWISFNSDGGSIIDSQFVLHGDKLVLGKTPTKPGYTFDGWYNGLTKVENGATVTSPMTLTAHWKAAEVNYTVIHWWENADDDEYAFHESQELQGLTGATTTAAAKSYTIKGKNIHGKDTSDKVFTATTIEQKTIKGDGSTIVNVYYKRKTYTMHFKERSYSRTDYTTITKKWGQSISKKEWPTYNGNGNWQISDSRYLAYTSTMPMNDSTLWSTSGRKTFTAYYYVRNIEDTGYELHHKDVIKSSSNYLTIGQEDCYAIAGFTYDHGDPGVGGSYNNSEFYYTRNSYKIKFINNGKEDKSVEKKYEQSISNENYTPARPSSLPDYYEFDGWYDNELCEGEKYVFNGKTMPAQNITLYAKWTAKKISLIYNLNNPEGTVDKGIKKVAAGTIASTVLPSASAIEGYSFAGWYVVDENGHMTNVAFNANDAILKDTNVIGKWLYNGELKVKYVADGVEAPKDNNVYAGGAKATVANGVTKDGKKFLGWKLKENLYHPGDAFEVNKDLANDTNVITLTAVWGSEEHSTTMSYNPGNGRGDVTKVEVKNNESVTLKSEKSLGYQAPEAKGKEYYFAGWATSMDDANNGKATYAAGQTVHVDVNGENVLYATWIEKTVITLVAKSNTVTYNGEAQSVEGFENVADGYTISGLTAKATGTDFGKYDTEIKGTAKVTKDGKDVTEKVVVNVVPGKLTISKRNVTLTSASDEKVYDGHALTNNKVTASVDGFAKGEGATYNVTGTITNVGEKANAFTYTLNEGTNADNYNITKTEGTLKVTPVTDKVTVTITGNTGSEKYDGNSHKVTGYTSTFSNALYTEANFEFSGKAEASRTDAGQTVMGLTSKQFTNTSANFTNVEFVVTDGYSNVEKRKVTLTSASDEKVYDGNALTNNKVTESVDGFAKGEGATYKVTGTITNVGEKANAFAYTLNEGTNADNYNITKTEGTLKVTPVTDKVVVEIKGKTKTETYNGNTYEVEGYDVTKISDAVYPQEAIHFEGTAKASRKEEGTSYMGLNASQFSNTSANFTNVTFRVTDGWLKVTPKSIDPEDEKTGIKVSKPKDTMYNGEEQKNKPTVEDTKTGATLKENVDYELSYTAAVNAGTVEVTITGIGNYTGTAKTSYEITKRDVLLTSATDSKVYDKKPLMNGKVTESGSGFVKEEGATYNVTGSQTEKGTSKNTFTYELKSNTKASNYTIKVVYGDLTVTAEDGEVVVVITGHKKSFEYDGTEKSVKGYDVSITEGSTYSESDFTFSGNDEVKGTEAGTYDMGLKPEDFTNNNENYGNVTFRVTDGQLIITPKSITPDGPNTPEEKKTGITATDPADSIYDGKAHVNPLTVTDTKTGKDLVENKDYTLTYSDDVVNVGTVTVTVKGIGNYTGEFTKKYQITPREYTVTTDSANKTYDGTALTAGGHVNGLVEGETVSFKTTGSQTNEGTSDNTYELKFEGTAVETNYKHGKDSIGKLKVTKKSIVPDGPDTPDEKKTGIKVTKPDDTMYNGKEQKNKPVVRDTKRDVKLVEDTDYTLSYTAAVNAGTVTVTITGIGNYEGTVNTSYEITPRKVTMTSADDAKVYDGNALTKKKVTESGNGFVEGEGATYDVTGSQTDVGFSDNTFSYTLNKGTLASNYTIETKEGKLEVTPLTDKVTVTITGHKDTAVYDGKSHSVEGYDVTNISNALYKKADVQFNGTAKAEGIEVGTYTMKLTPAQFENKNRNFADVEFVVNDGKLEITPKSIVPDGPNTPEEKKTGIQVTKPKDTMYNGEEQKNKPTVEDTKTGATLKENVDYELSYTAAVNAGTVEVTITGIGNYTGTAKTSYEITKRDVLLTSATDSKVYDKKPLMNGKVTESGSGFVKEEGATYNVTGSQTKKGSSKNEFTYELKSNTKASNYTIEVAYGDLTVTAENGEVVVVITGHKKSFEYDGNEKSVKGYDVSITKGSTYEVSDFTFNGNDEVKGTEANTYPMGLKVSDFTNNNDNYNKVKFVVTDGSLTITPKSITPDGPNTPEEKKTGITATDPVDSIYDGKAHVNPLTVKDTKTNKDLEENKDYTLTYSDDVVNVGTVTVTVKGIGNYTGEFTKKYQITPREYTVTTDSANKTYDGTALTAGGHVNGLVEGETVSFKTTGSQTNEGTSDNTYELKFKGTAVETNYKHGKDSIGKLTVKKQSIDPGTDPEKPNPNYLGIEISNPSDEVYDGKEHKWSPTVVDKTGKELIVGTDYAVEYATSDFTNAGTINVTITGIGNYTGKVTRTYSITPREYTITTLDGTKVYDGKALTNFGLVDGIVYGETYSFKTTGSQTEVGTSDNTYEWKWNGTAKKSNYKLAKESIGKLTVKAKSIVPDGPDTPDEKKTGITVSEPSDSKYDGKEHKEVLTVTDTKTGKELVAGTDYSVTYSSDLVNAGTVKVMVAGLGNYSGSFTKTYKITKRSVTLTSATVSKVYDGSALTNTSITVSGDGFVEGEGASYEVTGTQTEVGNSANAFEYKLNEKTLASNYNITKVVGTLTITAAPAPVTPATPSTPSTPSSTTSTTPRTPSAPQVTTPAETVEKETTPKAEPKKEEKVEEEYTPKASPQYYWALINLICAILTVLFGLLLLISKRHKSEDDDEEDDETKDQTTTNDDEESEQEKKRGLFTRVLAVLIAIVSVVFFLVTEDLSLPWTWTDQWTIWMVVIGLVQIVVFFVGRKWKNVDNDDEDEEAQQA